MEEIYIFEYLLNIFNFHSQFFLLIFFHNLHIFIHYILSIGCQKLVSCGLLVAVGTQFSVNKVLIFCVLQGLFFSCVWCHC